MLVKTYALPLLLGLLGLRRLPAMRSRSCSSNGQIHRAVRGILPFSSCALLSLAAGCRRSRHPGARCFFFRPPEMATISTLLLFSSLLMPCDAAADPPTPAVVDPRLSMAHSRADDAGVSGVVPAELWCVAKNNAEDGPLQAALDWACGQGGADCRPIQQGGVCFQPNDLLFHASYAFNDYYLRNGVSQQACDFGGTAALTSLDPGSKNCHFPSSSSARNGSFTGAAASSIGLGPSVVDVSGGHRRTGAGGGAWWPCRLSIPLLAALAAPT